MSDIEKTSSPHYASLTAGDFGLYFTVVFAWSFSWLPLTFQVGVVEPPISVAYRFFLSALFMFAIALATNNPLKFSVVTHGKFVLLGALIFSTNFVMFYYAGIYLVSGLLAVIFATATVFNVINSRLWLGVKTGPRVWAGIALGLSGLCIIFLPEIFDKTNDGTTTLIGLAFALIGTICFSLGNIFSVSLQKQNISVISSSAWGMLYGGGVMSLSGIFLGMEFNFDPSARYVISLLYLVVISSIIAFLTYLTLLRRIGPQRAAYATILFPIGALIVSMIVEGYQWTPALIFGVIAVLGGNFLVLSRKSG